MVSFVNDFPSGIPARLRLKAKTEQRKTCGKDIPGQYEQKCTVEEDQLSLP
jgi:hypothetical protein